MASEYDKTRAFGKPENLEKRLAMWANQLSCNPKYPWVGLGLIDDLKCACRELGGDPDKTYPDMRPKAKVPTEPVPEAASAMEYDL